MSDIVDSIIMLTGAEYRKMMAEIAASNHFAVKYLAHIDEQNVEVARLTAENAKLREALEAALEDGVGVSYSCDEDECGNYVCCGEVSYKPHAPDCWTLKARAALSGDKHE